MAKSAAPAKTKVVSYWCDQIATYEKEFSPWEGKSKKIIKRFKDERKDSTNGKALFNILWSNVQTLQPALYAQNPVPNVDRRFEADDKIGTVAARILERSVSYFVDTDLFGSSMSQVVLDRLLPGRGVAWVRYVPHFRDDTVEGADEVKDEGAQVTDDTVAKDGDDEIEGSEEAVPELYSEEVVYDYVHWQDFGHTWARTWEEVRGVWRKVYMTRKEMKDRNFKNWQKVPLGKEKEDSEDKQSEKKACIYEIWDRVTGEAIWIHKSLPEELDRRSDPLRLKNFFPCPKPLFATLSNDNLIPSPDYSQYQDQAKELDNLTGRIGSIQKALKVVGVYDNSAEAVGRILSEGIENKMIPVENWAVFGEKGGMKGVVDWFPMEMIVNVLMQLYKAREQVKQDLYEITGLADIIRGASDPRETLGAQKIKGQFATLRLDSMQKDVARFSRDLVRITGEIISEHFSIETIKEICGIKLLTNEEKQQIMAKIQQASSPAPAQPAAPGAPPPQAPPPVPDEIQELLDNPTWEEVEELLRNDVLRCFRISIETDSTIKADQESEKTQRVELIGAVGQYLQQAANLPPTLQPLAADLLMFGVRGFKVSREMETTFDVAMKKIKKMAEAPPGPSAEEQAKTKELDLKEREVSTKEQEAKDRAANESKRIDADVKIAALNTKAQVTPEVAMSDPDLNNGQAVTPMAQVMVQMGAMLTQSLQQMAAMQAKANQDLMAAVTAPKTTQVLRDQNGEIIGGVQTVQSLQ